MARTAAAVDPAALVTAYAATPGGSSKAVTSVLREHSGDATIGVLADGTVPRDDLGKRLDPRQRQHPDTRQ
jgi:hypothetical protein